MSEDAYLAMRIEQLANEGVPAGELLADLPDETLIDAMHCLNDAGGVGAREGYLLRAATVRRVLQAELDGR